MQVATINIELEPTVIGVGPLNVAIAMNNRAWFYEMNEGSQNLGFFSCDLFLSIGDD